MTINTDRKTAPPSPGSRLNCLGCSLAAGLLALGMISLLSGCRLATNPFHDELAHQPPVMTPSVEAALTADAMRRDDHRPFDKLAIRAEDERVLHHPLYFQDACEDACSHDRQFAWKGIDWLQRLTSPLHFLINIGILPVTMVIDPPWAIMASDGRPSREFLCMTFDSERWSEQDHQRVTVVSAADHADPNADGR